MYTKEKFHKTITALKEQYDIDEKKSEDLSKVLGCDFVPPQDNSRLVNIIFDNLHKQFPPKDDFCEIQTFCYTLNFGRVINTEKDPIDELWDQLTKDNATSELNIAS